MSHTVFITRSAQLLWSFFFGRDDVDWALYRRMEVPLANLATVIRPTVAFMLKVIFDSEPIELIYRAN